MKVKKLYVIEPSNRHHAVVSKNLQDWNDLQSRLNKGSSLVIRKLPRFGFHKLEGVTRKIPNVSCVYISGALAARHDFALLLLPDKGGGYEWIPIEVEGESWCLLNCFSEAHEIDLEHSDLMRGHSGEICFVSKLSLRFSGLDSPDLFVLANSNKAQLFATDRLRDRVKASGAEGINFREIGEVSYAS